MFVNSIDTKPFFTRSDGVKIRDLTQTMFELKNREYIAYNVYKVPKEYVMRPDLIAKSVYNNSLYAEVILKYNGISNPFSINEGDIILIPDLDSAKSRIKISGDNKSENKATKIRNSYKYIDPLKKPKKSDKKELQKFDERLIGGGGGGTGDDAGDDAGGGEGGLLPPNFAEEGTSQVTYRNGRVYFGEGVETCLKNGISTSEFLTNVIKNRK